MTKEIFINVDSYEKRVAVVVNKRVEEFYAERAHSTNIVGNIYKGRVESVIPAINAAFVDLGLEKNGFLHISDVVADSHSYEKFLEDETEDESQVTEKEKLFPAINDVLKKNDEVVVQVVKEPIGTKGARLTTHISIPGRFMVLMPFDKRIGLSKRISDRHERDRIRKILEELKLPEDTGFIVRTAAESATKRDIFKEMGYLIRLWRHVKYKSGKASPPQLVHSELDLILRVVRDIFTNDVSRLEIDGPNEFKKILKFLRIYSPELRSRLKFYNEKIPLFEKYDISRQIDRIYNRIVGLKSGGYLVFDETESLIAIDVNSGKSVGERNLEETAFKTNLEAAEEIPRQLKLRDAGGIIIIDFIDMESSGHRKAVTRTLERHIEADKAKAKILNISRIGLVEMTRQRVRQSIESKSYDKCPYCNGRGAVKSIATIAIELTRKLTPVLAEKKTRDITVTVNPEVASYLVSPKNNMIRPLERRFRKAIKIVGDASKHIEDVRIV